MPSLADMLAGQSDCPQPAPPPIPHGFDLELELPPGSLAGDRFELEVTPGIVNEPGGGPCGILRGRTLRDELASEWAELVQPAGCTPVPEPSLVVALLVGVIWLGVAAASGPVIGRYLERIGRQCPRPNEKRPEAEASRRSLPPT